VTFIPGGATAANQSTENTDLSDIDSKIPALVAGKVPVDPSGVTSPVSVAGLPLPAGASTESTLAAIKAKTDNLDVALSTRTKPGDTQPVSAASLPLPAGAATETSLGTDGSTPPSIPGTGIRGWLRSIYDTLKATLTVSVSNFPATQQVSAASLPLPTGASTEATLAAIKAKTDNLDVALSTRTKPADTQPVSAASLPLPTGAATEASLGTDGATPPSIPGTGIRGWLRSIYDTLKATLTVSGTVTANAGTNLNTSALALETGGNLAAAKADLDTIAAATSAGVNQDNVKQWGGTAVQAAATGSNDGTGANPVVRNISRRFGQILTTTPLAAAGVFNSAWFDTNQTGDVFLNVTVRADQASAANGFQIQESDDTADANFQFNITHGTGSNANTGISVVANTTTPAFAQVRRRFWRVQYTNGATLQGSFKLAVQTSDKPIAQQMGAGGAIVAGATPVIVAQANQTSFSVDNSAASAAYNVGSLLMLYGPNGATNNWYNQRTAIVFKTIAAVAVTAGTPVAIWTPTSGKKFRLMGYALSLSVAGAVILKDATTEMIRTCLMPAGIGQHCPPGMGNGILSALANNVLNADVSATGSISGFVFGTEE
jgi:hypothetical protein